MKVEAGKKYLTKAGDTVQVDKIFGEFASGHFVAFGPSDENGHRKSYWGNRGSQWNFNGAWTEYPGGIYDLVKEA